MILGVIQLVGSNSYAACLASNYKCNAAHEVSKRAGFSSCRHRSGLEVCFNLRKYCTKSELELLNLCYKDSYDTGN